MNHIIWYNGFGQKFKSDIENLVEKLFGLKIFAKVYFLLKSNLAFWVLELLSPILILKIFE